MLNVMKIMVVFEMGKTWLACQFAIPSVVVQEPYVFLITTLHNANVHLESSKGTPATLSKAAFLSLASITMTALHIRFAIV